MLLKTVQLALLAILKNRMRSALTTLGIVIGVGSVIAMVMLGDGATENVKRSISSLGENLLILTPGAARHGPGRISTISQPFEREDAEAIRREVPGLELVAPAASRPMLAVFGSKNHRTTLIGTDPSYFDITNHGLERGRWMTASELSTGHAVCVIGQAVRSELFGAGDPIGNALRLGSISCTVVGLLAEKGSSGFQDPNDVVAIPLLAFQRRIAGNTAVSAIYMSARADRSSQLLRRQVELLMRERRRVTAGEEDDFNVRDMEEIIETVASTTRTLTALLGGIAAVSLLVGGIGIMNIMLVSVTERTREIGIRLAVGARGADVLLQFLVEAIVLSMFGGLLGVVFGLGVGYGATRLFDLPLVLSPEIVLLAVVFSALVGVFFGFLPARRAARLDPIEALRHE